MNQSSRAVLRKRSHSADPASRSADSSSADKSAAESSPAGQPPAHEGSPSAELAAQRTAAAARAGVSAKDRRSAKLSSSRSRRGGDARGSSSRRVDLRAKPTLFESLGLIVRFKGIFLPDPVFASIGCFACVALSFLLHIDWLPLFLAPVGLLGSLCAFCNLRLAAMVMRAHLRCKRLVPAVALWRYLLWCAVPSLRTELVRHIRALRVDVTLDPKGFCVTIELDGGSVVEAIAASLLADALCRPHPHDTIVERGNKGLEVFYEGREGVGIFRLADDYLRQLMGKRVRRLGDEAKRAKYVTHVSADTVLGPLSRATEEAATR